MLIRTLSIIFLTSFNAMAVNPPTSKPVAKPAVKSSTPLVTHKDNKPMLITRANRWEGSIRGCLENLKKQDPAADSKMLTHLICACVATDLIVNCVPKDDTPPEQLKKCMEKRATGMDKLVNKCSTQMPLKL